MCVGALGEATSSQNQLMTYPCYVGISKHSPPTTYPEPWSDISDTPPDSTGHIGHHRTCFFGHYRTLNRTLIGHCTGHDRTVPDTNRTVQGTAMSKMSNLRPDRSDTNRTVPDRSDSRVIAASPMDATSPPRAHNSPGLSQACSRT